MSNPLDYLNEVPARPRDEWAWATVTSLSPLQVRCDGDAAPLLGSPQTLVNVRNLHVGGRVRLQFDRSAALGQSGARPIITGPSDLETGGVVNIPGSANLDTYLHPGSYVQRTNANASSGSNYPEALAGLLVVDGSGSQGTGDMIWQTYATYGSSIVSSTMWRRQWYNGTWSAWLRVSPPP